MITITVVSGAMIISKKQRSQLVLCLLLSSLYYSFSKFEFRNKTTKISWEYSNATENSPHTDPKAMVSPGQQQGKK